MKFTITFDCTPEEARSFFGLPDVQPMQTAMMQEMETRMLSGIRATDPANMMQNFVPGFQAFEQFQKMFWQQMQGMAQGITTQAMLPPGNAGKQDK